MPVPCQPPAGCRSILTDDSEGCVACLRLSQRVREAGFSLCFTMHGFAELFVIMSLYTTKFARSANVRIGSMLLKNDFEGSAAQY